MIRGKATSSVSSPKCWLRDKVGLALSRPARRGRIQAQLGRQSRTRGFSESAIAYTAIPVAGPGTAIGKNAIAPIKTRQNGRNISGSCWAAPLVLELLAVASGDNPRSRPPLTLAFIFAPTNSKGLLQD